jgi:hypothetical protein
VAKATRNTVFKVTYFKEALSIGSNGSSIRALENQGKVARVWTLTLGRATDMLRRGAS